MCSWSIPQAELMLRTNGIGIAGIAIVWVWTREWVALAAAAKSAGGAYLLTVLSVYGVCSFVSIAAYLALIRCAGSAVGVAVSTLRKVGPALNLRTSHWSR